MIDPTTIVSLIAALVAGVALGGLYFGALWLSVRAIAKGGGPAGLILGAALRIAAVVAALALALTLGVTLPALLVAGLGFLMARQGAARLARPDLAQV